MPVLGEDIYYCWKPTGVDHDGYLTTCDEPAQRWFTNPENGRTFAACANHHPNWSHIREISWEEALVADTMGS